MLEYVVRQAQAPNVLATRRIVASLATGEPDPAVITWGNAGTLPTPVAETAGDDLNAGGFSIEDCASTYDEKSRTFTTQRLMGSDGVSYLDVEVPSKINFSKNNTNQITGAFATGTTAFSDIAIPSTGTWGTVKKADKCSATYGLAER